MNKILVILALCGFAAIGCEPAPDMGVSDSDAPPTVNQPTPNSLLPPPAGPAHSAFKGCKVDKTLDLGEGHILAAAANDSGFIVNWQDRSAVKSAEPYALQTFNYDGQPMSDKLRVGASRITAGKNDFLVIYPTVLDPKVSNGTYWITQRVGQAGEASLPNWFPVVPTASAEDDNYRLTLLKTESISPPGCQNQFVTGLLNQNGHFVQQDECILDNIGCFQATEGIWIQDTYRINDVVLVGVRQNVFSKNIFQYHLAALAKNHGYVWYNLAKTSGKNIISSFALNGEIGIVWNDAGQNRFLSTMGLDFGPGVFKTTYQLPKHFAFNYFDGEMLIGLLNDEVMEKYYLARVSPTGNLVDKVELPADYMPEFSIVGKNGRYVVASATTSMVSTFKTPKVTANIITCK